MAKKRANGEGNIRKRKDGRWEGRYTAGRDPVTGKAIYKNVLAKTQKECKEKLAQAIEKNGKIDVTKAGQYKEMKILPAEQIGAYFSAAEEHGVLPMFYLELTTGLRRGELTALPEISLVWVKSGSDNNCEKLKTIKSSEI